MKRKWKLLCVLFLAAALLSGCKKLHVIPYGAKINLEKQDNFTMVEGSSIVDFSISNRQTDDAAGTDRFTFHIDIDHPNATESRVYEMEYVFQDNIWLLKRCVEQTSLRWIKPKTEPTQEDIIRALKTISDEKIAAAFLEGEITDERSELRCFTESYFDASVDPGTMVDDNRYNCHVEIEHRFELVDIQENLLLKLEFDPDTYTWEHSDAASISTQSQWSIAGTWESPSGNMQLKIERVEESEEFAITCTMDGQNLTTTVSLSDPSHANLNPTTVCLSRMAGKPISLDLEIGPDKILCQDRIGNGSWYMCPVKVEKAEPHIGRGFQFVVLSEETLQYKSAADHVIDLLDMGDLVALYEMTPAQDTREQVVKIVGVFNSDQLEECIATYFSTQYYTQSSPNLEVQAHMEAITKSIPDVKALSKSGYILELVQDGQSKYYQLQMLIAHGEDSDYLLFIE